MMVRAGAGEKRRAQPPVTLVAAAGLHQAEGAADARRQMRLAVLAMRVAGAFLVERGEFVLGRAVAEHALDCAGAVRRLGGAGTRREGRGRWKGRRRAKKRKTHAKVSARR